MNIGEKICNCALNLSNNENNINNLSINNDGKIKFNIQIDKFCKNNKNVLDFLQNSNLMIESIYVDICGSILVRKFINIFNELFSKMDENEYEKKFIMYNHLHFNLSVSDNLIEFSFHISFLHDILFGKFVANGKE